MRITIDVTRLDSQTWEATCLEVPDVCGYDYDIGAACAVAAEAAALLLRKKQPDTTSGDTSGDTSG
jgi:hypothetical protein